MVVELLLMIQKMGVGKLTDTKTVFLPKYSKLYFEKKKNASGVFGMTLLYSGLIYGAIAWGYLTNGGYSVMSRWLVIFAIVIFGIYLICVCSNTEKKREKYGMNLSYEGVQRITGHGMEETISYQVYEEAVKAGQYHYDKTGLVIGKGKNKLVFHYEIGNAKAQENIRECYKVLQEHMQVELPPFETKGLGLLDKRYFYKKSLRNQTLSLLCATLLLLVVANNVTEAVGMGVVIVCPWEYISLYILFKDAVMLSKNHAAIKEAFAKCENMRMGSRYDGYLYFAGVLVVLMCLNTMILL